MTETEKMSGGSNLENHAAPHSPSAVESLAWELERMAEHATYSDHSKSPIVDEIAKAPSARPFVGAIRMLVKKLTAEGRGAPGDSIVLQLLRDSDLALTVRLELLREFLLCEKADKHRTARRDGLGRKLDRECDFLDDDISDAASEDRDPALRMLFEWADQTNERKGAHLPLGDFGGSLLRKIGRQQTRAVLDAARVDRSWTAYGIIVEVAAMRPEVGLAFARESARDGALFCACLAMFGLLELESMRDQVRELALEVAIAADLSTGHVRPFALSTLLRLPSMPAAMWPLFMELPDVDRRVVEHYLANRIGDDCPQPLEIFERWLRMDTASESEISDLCYAVGGRFVSARPSSREYVPLSERLKKRLLKYATEARQRGGDACAAARVVEAALYELSDADYTSLGVDELALGVAAADAHSRQLLMYAVSAPTSWGTAWATRLLQKITQFGNAEEKQDYAEMLTDSSKGALDAWCKDAIQWLLAPTPQLA